MNVLKSKSMEFSVSIVLLYKHLKKEMKETTMSNQILRSGTSIGANINEANFAETKKDFIHKLSISLKECSETIYWIELLQKTEFIKDNLAASLNKDAIEIRRILISSIKTTKSKMK